MNDVRQVTVGQVMFWKPCQPEYSRDRIEQLFAGRAQLNAMQIFALRIPAADRLWAVLHKELIPDYGLHELACRFAEQALRRERTAGRAPDPRSWEAIRVKRAWIAGDVTDDQLDEARAAVQAAVRAAIRAAGEAARGATRDVEKNQLATVRRWLRKNNGAEK